MEQQPNCDTAQVPALAQAISNGIAKKALPSFPLESFTSIHDLSQEQESQVISDIVRTQYFAEVDAPQLIKAIAEKKKASQKYDEISKKIREALPTVDAAAYFERVRFLTERIAAYEDSLESVENQIAELEASKPAREEVPVVEVSMQKKCPICGAESDSKFCPHCLSLIHISEPTRH